MRPETESALRSPSGFFIVVTVEGGESFTCQVVRSARVGETTMRVRRLGRPSELLHLADVIDARRATREDITQAACSAEQDSTTVGEDGRNLSMVDKRISSSSPPSLGISSTDEESSR